MDTVDIINIIKARIKTLEASKAKREFDIDFNVAMQNRIEELETLLINIEGY